MKSKQYFANLKMKVLPIINDKFKKFIGFKNDVILHLI